MFVIRLTLLGNSTICNNKTHSKSRTKHTIVIQMRAKSNTCEEITDGIKLDTDSSVCVLWIHKIIAVT